MRDISGPRFIARNSNGRRSHNSGNSHAGWHRSAMAGDPENAWTAARRTSGITRDQKQNPATLKAKPGWMTSLAELVKRPQAVANRRRHSIATPDRNNNTRHHTRMCRTARPILGGNNAHKPRSGTAMASTPPHWPVFCFWMVRFLNFYNKRTNSIHFIQRGFHASTITGH